MIMNVLYPLSLKYLFRNLVPKVSQAQPRCEPLKIPMCRSLNYTHTILPNFLNQSSQTEVKRTLRELKPYFKSKCSSQLKRFACFFLAPYCTSNGTLLPPCQSFCEKIKTDCGHLSVRLANLNCSIFPTLSRKRLCIGDPLTTMDCVGPHSRPCTGWSRVSLYVPLMGVVNTRPHEEGLKRGGLTEKGAGLI